MPYERLNRRIKEIQDDHPRISEVPFEKRVLMFREVVGLMIENAKEDDTEEYGKPLLRQDNERRLTEMVEDVVDYWKTSKFLRGPILVKIQRTMNTIGEDPPRERDFRSAQLAGEIWLRLSDYFFEQKKGL